MTVIETLRRTTEDHVIAALEDATFGAWPEDEAALLEFFNRMLDVRLGEGIRERECASSSSPVAQP